MTTRPAGRHRRGVTAHRPRDLLLLDHPGGPGTFLNSELLSSDFPNRDFLNSGIVPNGSPLFSPAGGRRAPRAAQARDRRAFGMALSAAVAGVTAAAIFGSFAPLHSTWMAGGAPGAAGGPAPQTPVPWSAAPLG